MIRCAKCGGDLDTAMHCTRCGQLPVTYTSVVPAAPQWGAIEEILRLLDVYGSLGYEGVPQAHAELAVLQAENEATKVGECGHNYDRRTWDGCPICAMMRGVAVRIGDLETKAAALQADNARMRGALDHAARSLTAIAIAETEEGNECLKDVRDTRRFAGSKAEVAREALSTKPEGECATPAPAGAFVTLDFFKLAVEIERAFRGWVEDITVRWDGITVRLRRLGAPAPAEVRLEHQVTKAEVEAMVNPIECIITSLAAAIRDAEVKT